MNDRYLFKAKRVDNGKWVQGYYYQIWENGYILWGMTNDVPNMIGKRAGSFYFGIMTDTEAKKFYDSKAWQTKRIEILKRDRFECQDCRARIQKAVAEGKWLPEKEKKIARAEQVHHIQELKEHPELALDNDNLISLCVRCHNIRHGRVPHKFKRKKKLASRERW